MTDAVDAATLEARDRLFSLMAHGVNGDSICADMMKSVGWPSNVVLDAIHAMLSGAMLGHGLTPSDRARFILAGTALEDPDTPGGWRLRGRAASTEDVIRAANVVLNNFSMPLLKYPGISETPP